jgi:2-keto-4-pentenoate hydratase/2-oxohepta-3-ene-1,7-dioic acid hydratase in catechol pathway
MFDDGSGPQTGVVVGNAIAPTRSAGTLLDLICEWDDVKDDVKRAAEAGPGTPLAQVKLLAPILRPGKIFAIGLNTTVEPW